MAFKYIRSHIGSSEAQTVALDAGAAYRFTGGHAVAVEAVNGPRGAGFDAARGLTLGLGLRNRRWSLDYAVLPMGELGTTHRFSLGARF